MAFIRRVQIKNKKSPLVKIDYIVCRFPSLTDEGVIVNFTFEDGTLISDAIELFYSEKNRYIKKNYQDFCDILRDTGGCFSSIDVNFHNYLL